MAEGRIQLISDKNWTGYISYRTEASAEKNTTAVEASCYVKRTDDGESWGNNPYWGKLWIGAKSVPFDFPRLTGQELYAAGCWAEIPHDAEGKASVEIGAILHGSDHNDLTGSTLSGRKTLVLPPISQAGPSPVKVNVQSQQMGKKVLISIEPDHPDCVHELSYRFGETEGSIGSQVGTSFSWTVPDLTEFCTLEGLCTICCRTFFKDRDLGTTETQLTLTVPDPTRPELPDAVLGRETEILCRRNGANFTQEISLILNKQEYAVGKGAFDRLIWKPDYTLARAYPALRELKGSLLCRTFNSGVSVGEREIPILLKVPENDWTRPKILGLTLSPYGEEKLTAFGYLRGKTGVKAVFEAESACSQLESFGIRAGQAEARGNPAVIRVLEDAGKLTVTAEVRDARGFAARISREITAAAYEKPRILPAAGEKTVICERADEDGTLNREGRNLRIRAGVLACEIPGEKGNLNRGKLSFRLRAGEGAFGPWQALKLSPEGQADVLLSDLVPSLKVTYGAELQAEDSLGETTTLSFPVYSRAVSFSLYDGVDGAAFGKYPEAPHVVDVAEHMTLLVRGNLELRGETWQDLGLAPQILPPVTKTGTVEGAKLRLSGGNHVILAFSCRMSELAVNREPIPEALRPPAEVSCICPSEGGAVTVTAGKDGFLRITPLLGSREPGWIDGRVDYWI